MHLSTFEAIFLVLIYNCAYAEEIEPAKGVTNNTDLLFPFGPIPLDEDAKLFEGDIIPLASEIKADYGKKTLKTLREKGILPKKKHTKKDKNYLGTALGGAHTHFLWKTRKNDVVQVPYAISMNSGFSSSQVSNIKAWIKELADSTGVIEFVERSTEQDYILVQNGIGCSSYVGNARRGGQALTLNSSGCVSRGIVQHEFMHALGFYHEQSRPDRDQYVKINYENIRSGMEHNFHKRNYLNSLGSGYDFGSVMHYSRQEFSANGEDTITSRTGASFGQRSGASRSDIEQIRLLYQCKSGFRTLKEYKRKKCTIDCPCWEGKSGCNGLNRACQGSLSCKNNRCVKGVGGNGSYTKKYSKKWPHCTNIKCLHGSNARNTMEAECNKYSYCTGFSFSAGQSRGSGCLKQCGSDDSVGGYGYNSHDYWEKKVCQDNHTSCHTWAHNYGYCKGKYEAWMSANCQKSCSICR